mgnify:FL=1
MKKAITDYAISPGQKFKFPLPGEILEFYDRICMQKQQREKEQKQKAELEAVKFLFHEPVEKIENNYKKQAVQLIRDVCNHEIKFRSPEYDKRFREIFGVGYNPETGV